jgi:RecA/RadA recombinase
MTEPRHRRVSTSLEQQVKESSEKKPIKEDVFSPPPGNTELMISTGSTLLDLEISGLRIRGGGIPSGILVEIAGAPSSGKTVLLCEIAGNVQNKKGEVKFFDPESRLNEQFASMFGFQVADVDYSQPDTVPEVFKPIREWKPKNTKIINGIFADSLAALSTDLELEDGDKMGMRRAKEFSQECRMTCRILTKNNFLMVCSNQLRDSQGTYGPTKITPGGNAIPFYASLRLMAKQSSKIPKKIKVGGKEISKIVGVKTDFEINKSSVSFPYGVAPVYVIYSYGIDDIRGNLQYIKDIMGDDKYWTGKVSMDDSIADVEEEGKEEELRELVIDTWLEIQEKFRPKKPRTGKVRF